MPCNHSQPRSYDAFGPKAWGKRHETVNKRALELLECIEKLQDQPCHKSERIRLVACAELGDLLASYAIDYLRGAANDH